MATRSPNLRWVTEGWAARMTPADSWPRICVSVTTMGPIRPACQKWMSDLLRISRRFVKKVAKPMNVR